MSNPFIVASLLGLVACTSAWAQNAPPLKPGLWQVHQEQLMNGQKGPDLTEQMQKMSPDMRKRMQANMRLHGIDLSGEPGQMKICLSRESLDQGRWQGQQAGCKTEFTDRSSSGWKWHSSCGQPAVESEGESTFENQESYTVHARTTLTVQGKPQLSTMTMRGKWLGADCGDLKPITPDTLKK